MIWDKKYLQGDWALKVLIALCLLIPLAFSTRTFDQFGIPKLVIFSLGSGFLFLSILFNLKKLKNLPNYLRYALMFFFLTQVFQTIRLLNPASAIFGSYGQSESFLTQCGFIILFLSGYIFVKKESDIAKINLILIISIYVTGLFGIFQYYFNDPITQTQITRVKSLFGDPNSFGVFLVLVLIMAFHEFESKEKPWRRIFTAGGIYVGSTVLVLTFSRASWLGFIFSSMLYTFGLLIHYRRYKKSAADLRFLLVSLAVIVILGIFSAELLTYFQPKSHTDYEIKARITSIVKGNDSGRGLLWSTAFRIFKSSPWIGYGINSFQDNFHHFQSTNAINFWGPDRDLEQTHNEILHYLATQGLLGLGAYLCLLLAILIAVKPLRLFINPPENIRTHPSTTAIALSSAIAGYLIFIQFAYPLIHYSFLFWIFLGIITRIQSQPPESTSEENIAVNHISYASNSSKTEYKRGWILAVIILLLCGLGWEQFNIYTADLHYRKAFYQARYRHFPQSIANYQKAIALTPWMDYYKYRYAVTLNRAAQRELKKGNTAPAGQYFSEARVILRKLMSKNPKHYQFCYLLGMIAETRGEYTAAENYYQRALDQYPKNYKIIFRLAKMEKLLGNPKKASVLFDRGAAINPGYMKETALKEAVLF